MQALYDGGNVVGVVRRGDEAHNVLGLGQHLGNALHDGLHASETDEVSSATHGRTDVAILTVDALEVAVGEKDVADTFAATQGRLFALVDTNGGHFGLGGGSAKPSIYKGLRVFFAVFADKT
jgi:hypothetical protein